MGNSKSHKTILQAIKEAHLQLDSLCELARLGLGTLEDACSKANLAA